MRFQPVTAASIMVFIGLLILPTLSFGPFPHHVAGDTISSVYVNPVQTCCILPTSSSPVFTVKVMMNLSGAEPINGFDIKLNYTNFYSPSPVPQGAVKAVSVDYSNNIFVTQGYTVTTLASCIDDVTYGPSGICASDDWSGGQVHVSQVITSNTGSTISGPLNNAVLFSINFVVNATGTSVMYFDRAGLSNPGGIPANPHLIQVVTSAGIFGNDPLVAFLDYSSTLSPSVLSGVKARFDASSSFRSSSTGRNSLSGPNFKWNFGDGMTNQTSNPVITHSFVASGNYTVGLIANDTLPGGGFVKRIVQVVPSLGNLHASVRPNFGAALPGIVTAKIYNITGPVLTLCRACNQTVNSGGTADFRGLTPGTYSMNFTGIGVDPASKTTQVQLGWTTMETVYMTVIQPPPPNTIGLEIFAAIVGSGLSLVGLGLVVRWRRKGSLLKATGSLSKKTKSGRTK